MKRFALALGISVLPTVAYGQTVPILLYGEADAGVGILQDVKTKTYSGNFGGSSGSIQGSLSYNPSITAGAEVGLAGFDNGTFRIGASYDYLGVTIRRAKITGTVDGQPFDLSATRSQLAQYGISFDNNVNVLSANVYANVLRISDSVQAYVGIGGGAAVIQNANTVPEASFTAGLRFPIGPLGYMGLRYRGFYVTGPKDDLGIQYESVITHTISIVIGGYLAPE